MVRARISRPSSSVPNGCARDGLCKVACKCCAYTELVKTGETSAKVAKMARMLLAIMSVGEVRMNRRQDGELSNGPVMASGEAASDATPAMRLEDTDPTVGSDNAAFCSGWTRYIYGPVRCAVQAGLPGMPLCSPRRRA